MKQINKVAVLGAGVMGATIAAHLANAGIRVLLLDIVPKEPNEAEKKAGLTLNDHAVRNRIAVTGLEGLRKMKPAAFFIPAYASYIEAGNFDDDVKRLRECDWVIEVVVEKMEIKKRLFSEKVAPNLKEGAILSTNTSGLSVNEMAESLPEAVRKNFLVTHFFNPPRYMRLLEVVPNKYTDPDVVRFMAGFIAEAPREGDRPRQGHTEFHRQPGRRLFHLQQHAAYDRDGHDSGRRGCRFRARHCPPEKRHLPHR